MDIRKRLPSLLDLRCACTTTLLLAFSVGHRAWETNMFLN